MRTGKIVFGLAGVLLGVVALCGCAGRNVPGQTEPGQERMGQTETGQEKMEQTEAGQEKMEQKETGEPETKEADRSKTEEESPVALFEGMELTESYKGLEDTNPLMTQRFGADPYAMVYDGRVYFYMTADAFVYDGAAGKLAENTYGRIRSINVISTSDMVNFTDHGAIQAAGEKGAAAWAKNSWAPAAVWKEIDGKPRFFLYFADAGGGIGVLVSDSPTGPFTDPLGKGLVTRETPNCADVLWLFDPAVLLDDDGKAYLYFGGGVPEGKVSDPGTARVVELGDDMISIAGDPVRIDAPYLFEDSGIHKVGGKYYYTYCTNWQVDQEGTDRYGFHNAEIVSMESDSPLGPFTFKETILENPGKYCGLYGNNHHCVFSFQDNWYITYHTRALEKAMGVELGYRCTHVDEFSMGEDGTIGIIKQTMDGRRQLGFVDPYVRNRAANMAVMGGIECVPADDTARACGSGNMALGKIDPGDFILVKGVDFGSQAPTEWIASVRNPEGNRGAVKICADGPDGEVLGYLSITDASEAFTDLSVPLEQSVTGVHDLCLVFAGEGYEIDSWQFQKQ